jgi:hypothetical protein
MKRTWHAILIIVCSITSVGMSEPLSPEIEAFGRELVAQASELQSLGYQYEATVRYEQFVYPASPFGRKYAEPRKTADFLECRQRLIARGDTVRICATMVKTNNVERFAGPRQIPVGVTRCVWYTDKRVIAFWADGSVLYEIVDATPTSERGTGANSTDLRPDRLREWLDTSYPAHQVDRTQAHFQGANILAYREDPIIDPQADRSILWVRPKADGDIVVHARVRIDVPAYPSSNDAYNRIVRLERVGGELSLVGIAHSIQRVPDRYQTTEFLAWTRRAKPDGSGFLRFPTHVVQSSYEPDAVGKLVLSSRYSIEVAPESLRLGSEIDHRLLAPPAASASDSGAPVIDGSSQTAPGTVVRAKRADDTQSLTDELRITYLAWTVLALGIIIVVGALAMKFRRRGQFP